MIFPDHRSLTYLDQREFNNAKIRRWQEEISCYKFVLEYVEGQSNVWADMLSRSHGQKRTKTPADSTPAGRVFKMEGSDLHIYVPSSCLKEIDGSLLIPKTHTPQSTYCYKRMADAFFVYHSTSTISTEKNYDHLKVAAEQLTDNLLLKIIQALQTKDPNQECHMDPEDHGTLFFRKHLQNFYLESGTSVLMIRDGTHTSKLVILYKLRSRFLHVTRMVGVQKSRHRSIHRIL